MASRTAIRSIFLGRHHFNGFLSRIHPRPSPQPHRSLHIIPRTNHFSPHNIPINSLPLALLASSVALTVNADASPLQTEHIEPLSRVEQHTGVAFPVSLSPTEQLSGVGARFMRGLVKVYAVGIYLDPSTTRAALSDWRGFSAEEIATADPLWQTLCSVDAGFPRTVRMVVVRNVDGKHMQNGFERALLGRVAAVAKLGRCRPKDAKAAAKQFCSLFTRVGIMKIGSDIRISVDRDIVTLMIDDRFIGKVQNVQLAWAVLDMFVGSDSVVKGLREEVAKSLELVLKE